MFIPIELVVISLVALVFFMWAVWYRFTTKRLIKKYKPENGKSRKGGSEQIVTRESNIKEASRNITGYTEPQQRELLQKTSVALHGKNSNRSRNFLTRIKRRN